MIKIYLDLLIQNKIDRETTERERIPAQSTRRAQTNRRQLHRLTEDIDDNDNELDHQYESSSTTSSGRREYARATTLQSLMESTHQPTAFLLRSDGEGGYITQPILQPPFQLIVRNFDERNHPL